MTSEMIDPLKKSVDILEQTFVQVDRRLLLLRDNFISPACKICDVVIPVGHH